MNYFLGIMFAIITGLVYNFGWVLQKKVVNDLLREGLDAKKLSILIRRPLWVIGVVFTLIITMVFFLISQSLIGPALIPGLMSAGYIVLIVGSVKIIKTKLIKTQVIGIIIIIVAILLLSFSQLQINLSDVQITNSNFLLRTIIYSIIIFTFWQTMYNAAKFANERKGILKSISSAIPFCLSDFWVIFSIAMIDLWINQSSLQPIEIIFLILSVGIFIWANLDNVWETQTAFQYKDANVVIPIQQIPTQISPIFVYYIVFMKLSPEIYSFIFLLLGVILLIISGFLLNMTPKDK